MPAAAPASSAPPSAWPCRPAPGPPARLAQSNSLPALIWRRGGREIINVRVTAVSSQRDLPARCGVLRADLVEVMLLVRAGVRKPVKIRHGRATVSKLKACQSGLPSARGPFDDGTHDPRGGSHEQLVRTWFYHHDPPGRPADFKGPGVAGRHRDRRAGGLLLHRRRSGRAVGVRQEHGDPRVRPRFAALPRLPLPLMRAAGQLDLDMEKKLILRGALAGTIAGVLAFVFARIFAEPV